MPLDRHRVLRAPHARFDLDHVGHHQSAALPGAGLEPVGIVGGIGWRQGRRDVRAPGLDLVGSEGRGADGFQGHGHRHVADVAAEEDDDRRDAEDGTQEQNGGADGASVRHEAEGAGEAGAEDGAPGRGDDGGPDGVGQQRCVPGLVGAGEEQVAVPRPLAGEADGADADAAQHGEPQPVGDADGAGDGLDHQRRHDEGGAVPGLDGTAAGTELGELRGGVDDRQQRSATRAEHEADGHQAERGAHRDQQRVEDLRELRHAEAELALAGDQALQREPCRQTVQEPRPAAVLGMHARLGEHEPAGEPGEAGTEDHQHVRRAPHGDVDAERPVPHLVHREAGDGADAEGAERDHRPRDPEAGDVPAALPAVERGHDRAQHRTRQDPDEPEEDQGVGGGHQGLVTAQRHVPGDVAVEADAGDEQRVQRLAHGDRRPARQTGEPGETAADALERAERVLVARGGRTQPPQDGDHHGVRRQQADQRVPRREGAPPEGARRLRCPSQCDPQHVTHSNVTRRSPSNACCCAGSVPPRQ